MLESWMRSIAALRNHCAHHARLWNRFLNATPQMNAKLRGLWISNHQIDANKLYATLCCIAYWLDSMDRGESFRTRLKMLLDKYPSVDTIAMGFPRDWENEPLWKTLRSKIHRSEVCLSLQPRPTAFLALHTSSYVLRKMTIVSSRPERPYGVITSLTSINSLTCET